MAYIARRRAPARLLILGTCRSFDAMVHQHPLPDVMHDLQSRGLCDELALSYLPQTGVASYMAQRFQTPSWPERSIEIIHQRTHGNPLFLVMIIDHLERQGALEQSGAGRQGTEVLLAMATDMPDGIRQSLLQQLNQLDASERTMLEAASVAGIEFTTAAVAAGVEHSSEAIEACCNTFASRGQFLRHLGTTTWPNGEMSDRYGFVHALYLEVLYDQLPSTRRARLHRQIGLRLERGHGDQASQIAAALALHFDRGGDAQRAVSYLYTAANTAVFRSAYTEAIAYLEQGIALLQSQLETPETQRQELKMQLMLGTSLLATQGYGPPEVVSVYDRALALCQGIRDQQAQFQSLIGLMSYYLARADLATMLSLTQQALRLAEEPGQPPILGQSVLIILGQLALHQGEFMEAQRHLGQTLDLCRAWEPGRRPPIQDAGVVGLTYLAWTSGFLGYLEQAHQYRQEALERAQKLDHPLNRVCVFVRSADVLLASGSGCHAG